MATSLVLTGIQYSDYFVETSLYSSTKRAIFGYGTTGSVSSLTNLVSNIGVVAADVTGVGTARSRLAAAGYGS
jgi:hypothetical protein